MTQSEQRQQQDMKQHQSEAVEALIAEQVIHRLGRPGGLQRIQVRGLWEDHYRVNVMVGPDTVSATIADSYFVQADGDGKIIASTPEITKRY